MGRPVFGLIVAGALALPGLGAAQEGALGTIARPDLADQTVRDYVLAAREHGSPTEGESGTRIYGGRVAEDGAFPFQASLHDPARLSEEDGQANSQFCGASIIARQWILTAAHCVVDDDGAAIPPAQVAVRTGANDLRNGDMRTVAEVIVHDAYDPRLLENDIALLRLAQPIGDGSGPVGAVEVLGQGLNVPLATATVVGWGRMEDGKLPYDLRETDVQIIENATCNAGYAEQVKRDVGGVLLNVATSNRMPMDVVEEAFGMIVDAIGPAIVDTMICAGVPSGKQDSCKGDSGGPLVMRAADGRWIQIGIVSGGGRPLFADRPCGHENLYGFYTRVPSYFDWIASHVRG